ncbi:hypothetical protein OA846_01425 [Paracoccaceae bacterium]|nr:hypothetical protein [Paracoccaceae bacterium]
MTSMSIEPVGSTLQAQNYITPTNNRPSMRDLMEKISGRKLEDLFADPNSNWQEISRKSSQILNGVLADKSDERNWDKIMGSESPVETAGLETNKLHKPKLEVIEQAEDQGGNTEATILLKDYDGVIVKTISDNLKITEDAFENFGITPDDITQTFLTKLGNYRIDPQLQSFLVNYAKKL